MRTKSSVLHSAAAIFVAALILTAAAPIVHARDGANNNAGNTGGGTPASATYKLSVSKNGSGNISVSPAGSTFAAGTMVTLTATPAVPWSWFGWSSPLFGNFAVVSTQTITVTMNANISLTANFR